MKRGRIYIIVIVAFVMGFLLNNFLYQKQKKVVDVPINIPKIEGKTDTIYLDKVKEVKIPGKDNFIVDSTYYYKYLNEKDKTKQLQVFLNAIKIQDTVLTVADNDTIKIDIWSKTRGKLLQQSASYHIKARNIVVPIVIPKPARYEVYGGVGLNIPTLLGTKVSANFKLDLNVSNNTIYSVGYDTNKNIMLGISKSIFKIK